MVGKGSVSVSVEVADYTDASKVNNDVATPHPLTNPSLLLLPRGIVIPAEAGIAFLTRTALYWIIH